MRFILISTLITVLLSASIAWLTNNVNWLYVGSFVFLCIILAGSKYIQKYAGKLSFIPLVTLTVVILTHLAESSPFLVQTTELLVGGLVLIMFALFFNLFRGFDIADESKVERQKHKPHTFTPAFRADHAAFNEYKMHAEDTAGVDTSVGVLDETQEELVPEPDEPRGPTVLDTLPDTTPEVFVAEQIDWNRVNKQNKLTGNTGERIVVAYEQNQLREAGHHELADRVEHTAQVVGDGTGYDVLSFFSDGRKKYIEVKSTHNLSHSTLFITHNELSFLREHPEQTFVYCVTEATSDSPKVTRYSAEQFLHFGNLTPAEYKFFV